MEMFLLMQRKYFKFIADRFDCLLAHSDQYSNALNLYRDIRKTYSLFELITIRQLHDSVINYSSYKRHQSKNHKGLIKVLQRQRANQERKRTLYKTVLPVPGIGYCIYAARNKYEAVNRINKQLSRHNTCIDLNDVEEFNNDFISTKN